MQDLSVEDIERCFEEAFTLYDVLKNNVIARGHFALLQEEDHEER